MKKLAINGHFFCSRNHGL